MGLLALLCALLVITLTPAHAAEDDASPARAPTVLIGAGALAWVDISADDAPTMLGLAGRAAAANMSVRTVRTRSCVVDGWLTIGAGRRTADVPARECDEVPQPRPRPGRGVVAGNWDVLGDPPEASRYQAQGGLLGDALARANECATAVGPGAALALAQGDGTVPRYLDDVGALTEDIVAACPLTVVDAGFVPHLEGRREQAAAVETIDQTVALVQGILPKDGTLMVAGVSDSGPTPPAIDGGPHFMPDPALRLALAEGGGFGPRWLVSSSTRWDGVVQITDITASLFEAAGLDFDPTLAGSGWRNDGPHPSGGEETVEELVALDRAEKIFRKRYSDFYPLLGYIQAAVYGLTLLLIGWRSPRGLDGPPLSPAYMVAFVAASIPAASFLTNLTGWWRFTYPELALWTILVSLSALIALIAAYGPWRRRVYGPPAAIALFTSVVLATDVLTGSTLQHLSLLGLSPTVAGRFYGFGNIPSAIFAASVLFTLATVASLLRERGVAGPLQSVAVLALGVPAALLVGSPNGGADFGGLLSLIPGVLVLALGVAGKAVTLLRLVLIGVASAAVVAVVSLIDWMRPPEDRSHLGDFVQSIIDGSALNTIARKYEAMVGTLDNAYSWLVPVAYIVIWALVLNKRRPTLPALDYLEAHWSAFRALVVALLVSGAVGFAVNDSGMIVPAMLASTAIPLAVVALIDSRRAVAREQAEPPTGRPGTLSGTGPT